MSHSMAFMGTTAGTSERTCFKWDCGIKATDSPGAHR